MPSPICMTRSANGPHRIRSGDLATDVPRLSNFDSCKMPRSRAASLKSPACLRLILNIEFLPNSRHACQIAARVSPVAESGLRSRREGRNQSVRSANISMQIFPFALSPCVSLSWTQNCIGHRIRMEMCPTSSWAKSTTKGLQSESKTIEEMCNE